MIFDLRILKFYPPFLCRVMARRIVYHRRKGKQVRGVIPITTAEISKESGLDEEHIRWIEGQGSWDLVTVGDAVAFLKGCQLLSLPTGRAKWFLNRLLRHKTPLRHLELLPDEERQRVSRFVIRGLSEMLARSRSKADRDQAAGDPAIALVP